MWGKQRCQEQRRPWQEPSAGSTPWCRNEGGNLCTRLSKLHGRAPMHRVWKSPHREGHAALQMHAVQAPIFVQGHCHPLLTTMATAMVDAGTEAAAPGAARGASSCPTSSPSACSDTMTWEVRMALPSCTPFDGPLLAPCN